MRALIQRVTEATVQVDGVTVGAIGAGLCVFVGVTHGDDDAAARRLAEKVWHLRVFGDADGVMNLSLAAAAAADGPSAALVVSQFTLYGAARKGRRPSWVAAAPPELAEPLVDAFAASLRDLGATVETGRFRADMRVTLVNDGPVTLLVEV